MKIRQTILSLTLRYRHTEGMGGRTDLLSTRSVLFLFRKERLKYKLLFPVLVFLVFLYTLPTISQEISGLRDGSFKRVCLRSIAWARLNHFLPIVPFSLRFSTIQLSMYRSVDVTSSFQGFLLSFFRTCSRAHFVMRTANIKQMQGLKSLRPQFWKVWERNSGKVWEHSSENAWERSFGKFWERSSGKVWEHSSAADKVGHNLRARVKCGQAEHKCVNYVILCDIIYTSAHKGRRMDTQRVSADEMLHFMRQGFWTFQQLIALWVQYLPPA